MPTRELTVDLFVTLDGFAYGTESPAYFGYLGPDLQRWIDGELARPQVVLMGRVTYETMAAISQSGSYDDANRMTDLPKVVFSRTLQEPLAWANTRLVTSDLAEATTSQTSIWSSSEPPSSTRGSSQWNTDPTGEAGRQAAATLESRRKISAAVSGAMWLALMKTSTLDAVSRSTTATRSSRMVSWKLRRRCSTSASLPA
jgi:hypothetical protein